MGNHSYETDFDLHENETACRTHFHMQGFELRLVLKQRHKRTRKWPIHSVIELLLLSQKSMVILKSAVCGNHVLAMGIDYMYQRMGSNYIKL